MSASNKYIYKIVVRGGKKLVFKMLILKETDTMIKYLPNENSDTYKTIKKKDLEVLKIDDQTREISLNAATVFTLEESNVEFLKNSCINLFVNTLNKEIERLNNIELALFDVEWEEK